MGYFALYCYFGMIAFLYEFAHDTSKWKFSLFIGVCYPITILVGLIAWIVLGIKLLIKVIKKVFHNDI
jgi:hypothetical protein